MNGRVFLAFILLFFISVVSVADSTQDYRQDRLLVRFASAGYGLDSPSPVTRAAARQQILDSAGGGTVLHVYKGIPGWALVKIPAGQCVESMLPQYSSAGGIIYAEPDYKIHFYRTPNDTRFNNQWGMHNTGQAGGTPGADIDATDAWDIETGDNQIIVAVTDTGIDYEHEDLAGNMWINIAEFTGVEGVDDDQNGYVDDIYGYDFYGSNLENPTGDSDPCDVFGHGTHVSGIIGAVGNNNRGVAGVCWNVRLMAVKITHDSGLVELNSFESIAAEAIEYSIDNGADVINASWGIDNYSLLIRDAIVQARDAGVIFVASAGNDSSNIDIVPTYPAGYNLGNIISVLATNNIDGLSSYSSYGPSGVDIGAPGGDILQGGTGGEILSTIRGGGYGYMEGTSMAAPHVAGACALLLSFNPNLTYTELKDLLMDTADHLAVLAGRCVSGGRLNISNALAEIAVDETPPTPDPAQWASWGQPKETGLHTIAMEAKKAEDKSGVEYYFECVNDGDANSTWQSGTRYVVTGLDEGTEYTFRVRARDTLDNTTGWSVQSSATTDSGTDNSSPFPDPPLWQTNPYAVRLSPAWVIMVAGTATDESGVEYWFEETSGTGYLSGWQNSPTLSIDDGPFTEGNTYTFRFKVRDKSAAHNTSAYSETRSITLTPGHTLRHVPEPYDTIQKAIDASDPGDIVVLSPDITYTGFGNYDLHFDPNTPIMVRSVDPNKPAIVASTVIDCVNAHRGFIFNNHEDPNYVVAGLTIRNGWIRGDNGTPGAPPDIGDPQDPNDDTGATSAGDGFDGLGGGIACFGASPTIYKCVLDGCEAVGGNAGDPNGGSGGRGGSGYGGGIYCDFDSDPGIIDCEITACSTQAGAATDNESFGNSFGGGIYIEKGSNAVISGSSVLGCTATDVNSGYGSGGGIYCALDVNTVSITITDTRILSNRAERSTGTDRPQNGCGGGIAFMSQGGIGATLTNCEIAFNQALTDGGGIYFSKGRTLIIEDGSRIYNNQCTHSGGGIFAGDIDVPDATAVEISDSYVNNNSSLYGGGIYMDETALSIAGSYISNNTASEGAGINGAFSDVNVISSSINNNNAVTSSGIGGAMALWNCTSRMVGCVLNGNNAEGTGGIAGALYFSGFDESPKTLLNCLISNNDADNEGAGLFCHLGAWAKVTNCTIADNRVTRSDGAGGGISCAESLSVVQLKNSIVYGNTADYGPQIAAGRVSGSGLDPHAVVTVNYSDVQDGEDGVFEELPYASVIFGMGNWDEENPFVSVGGGELSYFLRHKATGQISDSNLIDSGTGTAADLISQVGFDLTTRIDGLVDTGMVDIGYHYSAEEIVIPDYQLTIRVAHNPDYDADGVLRAEGPGFETFFARNEPNTMLITGGVQVKLTAIADSGFLVGDWIGADDVPNTGDPCNIVTMNSNKVVTVYFDPNGAFYLYTDVPTNNGHIDYINSQVQRVVHPGRTLHDAGEVVQIIAVPDNPIQVPHWSGTDDDGTISKENTVTMDSEKFVTVSFIEPRVLIVGTSEYPTIQRAIDDASSGDIVQIMSGTWNIYQASQGHDHLELSNKDITITGENPDDPNTTVIQGGFIITNVTRNTLIQGLTITGNYRYFDNPPPTQPSGRDGYTGEAPGYGGGMRLHQVIQLSPGRFQSYASASPTVRNCIFRNCSVWGDNGTTGVGGQAGPPAIDSGNGGWGSWAHGGAVSCGPDSNPLFENCVFQGCFARGGDGGNGVAGGLGFNPGYGGNWGDETDPRWDDGPFLPYWKYSGYGGAVYVDSGCSAEFRNCEFIDNYVLGGSCGRSGLSGGGGQVAGWPYEHYKIDRFGGAVYAAGGSAPVFVDCNFIDNLSDSNRPPTHTDGTETSAFDVYEQLSYGGAIAFEDGASVTLKKCNFVDNTADVGGGVYCFLSTPTITDCNVLNNTAKYGGGILCVGGSGLIKNSKLTGNSATIAGGTGGAVALLGSNTDLLDSELIGNQAEGSGGGLYISSKDIRGNEISSYYEISVRNCLIAENTAGLNGAGISSNWHSFADIEFCTIVNNSVLQGGYGGGLYSSNGNYAVVSNSILWGNAAANGRQIAIRPSINPAGVAIEYSDIRGGNTYTQPPDTGGNIWVDLGCPFTPGQGNIGANLEDDPLFVSGILGDYYLSQTATSDPDQTEDSPCVDAGSGFASAHDIDMDNYTTRTDMVPDRGVVDMGYHYMREDSQAVCAVCDLVFDGVIDRPDLGEFVQQWLSDDCSEDNGWCSGADFNFDELVNAEDYAVITQCIKDRAMDTEPPVPNPSQWQTVPYSNSVSSILMAAKQAYDMWGKDVQYYFECSDANHSSDWQDEQDYLSQGLVAGRQYSYRVKTQDPWGNETEFSGFVSAVVNEDSTPPEPDPMTWAVLPAALSNTEITMTASVATDASGVEYGFRRIGGPTVWQDERTFTDTDLAPLTLYTYQTAARDKSDNQNVTEWSVEASAATSDTPEPPDTEPPVTGLYANIYKAAFSPTTFPDQPAAPGGLNPVEVFDTDGYYHRMIAADATDDSPPVQYRFICVDDSRFSSPVWSDNPFYSVRVSSISSKSNWKWRVQTRDSAEPDRNYGVLSDSKDCRGNTFP